MELIPILVKPIIEWGIREELIHGDHTGQIVAEPGKRMSAQIYAKQFGIVAGLPVAQWTFELLDPTSEIEFLVRDGDAVKPGDVLMRVTADAWVFSAAERLALDYLQHLSGIATKANRFVQLVEPYGVRITDARKGIPPIRVLQKYAVRKGGAIPHMYSLHNLVLVKDNHIKMCGGSIAEAVRLLREKGSHGFRIEVEVETLPQIEEALAAGADCIMLDNFDIDTLRDAVKLIDKRVFCEATGGVTEETVVEIAQTGVDQIAVGAIVHSVNVLDISIDIGDMKDSARRDIRKAQRGSGA